MQVTGEPGSQWAQVAYSGKAGWMDVGFLRMEAGIGSADFAADDGEMVTLRVPRAAEQDISAEEALDIILGGGGV